MRKLLLLWSVSDIDVIGVYTSAGQNGFMATKEIDRVPARKGQ